MQTDGHFREVFLLRQVSGNWKIWRYIFNAVGNRRWSREARRMQCRRLILPSVKLKSSDLKRPRSHTCGLNDDLRWWGRKVLRQ